MRSSRSWGKPGRVIFFTLISALKSTLSNLRLFWAGNMLLQKCSCQCKLIEKECVKDLCFEKMGVSTIIKRFNVYCLQRKSDEKEAFELLVEKV